ncbi:MAG: SH3 domain-containing protein [Anaerolineae bacterium]|nr:SH3 domain-containing protein [Anaerolineae bacterium]
MAVSPAPPPPDLPEDERTRLQTPLDHTRGVGPVKDVRLVQPGEMEKPKRGLMPDPGQRVRQNSALRLPLWSVILTLMLVCGAVSCVVLALFALGGRNAATLPPRIVVLTAIPSATPALTMPSLLASPTLPPGFEVASTAPLALSGPTLAPIVFTPTPTPAPRITIGSTVVVIGDRGINVRLGPGTDQGVVDVADPGDQFIVLDGPQPANGLNWWQLRSLDGSITGWAAENDGTTDLLQAVSRPE